MANRTPQAACTCDNTGRCNPCALVISAAVAREGRPPAQRTGIGALSSVSTAALSRKDAA